MMCHNIFTSILLAVIVQGFVFAQDSVIGLLKNNLRQGNQYYEQGEYDKALKSFKLISHNKRDNETELKIARCYYFMKKYTQAVAIYEKLESVNPLTMPDLVYCAEVNTAVGNYSTAIDCYNRILSVKPRDPGILQRIWQLNNVHLFFEDSLHYAVRRLPVNSQRTELSPVPFHHGIVFLSDRKEIDFKNPDQSENDTSENDFNLFYSEIVKDTTLPALNAKFKNPVNFGKVFHADYGMGPVSFYDNDTKCVFAGVGKDVAIDKVNKMQLFFSDYVNGKWSTPRSFEHNNKEYNLTDPSISPDGKTLYFSSDKPGGFGDSDIFRCTLKEGKWTVPENLGDQINTGSHESFPFLYYNTLYFSSDGHPGLGGLDIFSTIISMDNNYDIKNLGYPLNSGNDDFGFVLKTGSRGYFTSNRKNQGYDDDLYEFEMDFRTYPFDITGIIKLQDSNSADSLSHTPMALAKIELVDYGRNQVIARTQSDSNGKFSVSIPYFSKYVLRLFDHENAEYLVSLEINRESSKNSDYEIVVIKQSFHGIQKANFRSE